MKIDEFEHFPFIHLSNKRKVLAGELWGMEKWNGKVGYYRVDILTPKSISAGRISFEIGERKIYSMPMGWKRAAGTLLGVNKTGLRFTGKFGGKYPEDLYLNCDGDGCFKGRRRYSSDYP